jgi:hypothetical protein
VDSAGCFELSAKWLDPVVPGVSLSTEGFVVSFGLSEDIPETPLEVVSVLRGGVTDLLRAPVEELEGSEGFSAVKLDLPASVDLFASSGVEEVDSEGSEEDDLEVSRCEDEEKGISFRGSSFVK